MTTPLEISIALWYYCRVGDYGKGTGDFNFDAPAVQETLQRFVDAGLLKKHEPNNDLPQFFHNTDGLRVYVEALCAVSWPEQRWVMPAGIPPLRDWPSPEEWLRTHPQTSQSTSVRGDSK